MFKTVEIGPFWATPLARRPTDPYENSSGSGAASAGTAPNFVIR